MRRRDVISLLGAAAAWPLATRAQPVKAPRIGFLIPGGSGPSDAALSMVGGFLQGLQDLGYRDGQNVVIEQRFAEWNLDRLRDFAAEMARGQLDVIVALSTPAARAVQQATKTVPIVGIGMADPVADDLVASLARPGGNVTGTTFLGPELVAKRLQLLKEVVPGLSRVAALWHPHAYSERTMAALVKEVEAAARVLGMQLQLAAADSPHEIPGALAAVVGAHAEALIVLPSPMLFGEYPRIVSIATNNRLPASGAAREFADAGGLMSYGVNLADLARQTAKYADKILKGAKPAELPVELPTTFEIVLNLKAAKELGLTVSREFLLITDSVIE